MLNASSDLSDAVLIIQMPVFSEIGCGQSMISEIMTLRAAEQLGAGPVCGIIREQKKLRKFEKYFKYDMI